MIFLLLSCASPAPQPLSEEEPSCPSNHPPDAPEIRRLTDLQYKNAVQQLLDIDASDLFPASMRNKHFHTFASNNTITAAGAESVMLSAESILSGWLNPCVDAECAETLLMTRAEMAYRRQLTEEEQALYHHLFTLGLDQDEAIRLGLNILLQSPQFLYIVSHGSEQLEEGIQLSSPESRAATLSLFLLNRLPDAELLEQARLGGLSSRANMREQAALLLEETDFLTTLVLFHRDWLHLYRLDNQARDIDRFPDFQEEWFELMKKEQELFFTEIFWNGTASFSDLLYSPYGWVAPELRSIYDLPPAEQWERRDLSRDAGEQRLGILSRAAWTAAHSYTASTSPVKRGAWVLEQLLCNALAPPADVDMEIPPPEVGASTIRDRLAIHSENPSCASCHDQIDPIGFSFEHYDPIGKWRETWEDGTPIDASGSLEQGDFEHAQDLLSLLGTSERAQRCYAEKWFSFALGRPLTERDHCALAPISDRFIASGGDIRGLLVDIAASDPFLYLPEEAQ